MSGIELDTKINDFLHRKSVQFPRIGLINRDETRTVKFPQPKRLSHSFRGM